MRSLSEINADIARVEQLIAERDADPSQSVYTPNYDAAVFDYAMSGDRSGLDALMSRVRQAKEAQLQREAAEKQRLAQQEFQESLQKAQQEFTSAENEKNRAVQKEVRDTNTAVENAKRRNMAMRNLSEAYAAYNKMGQLDPEKGKALAYLNYSIREAQDAGLPDEYVQTYRVGGVEAPKPKMDEKAFGEWKAKLGTTFKTQADLDAWVKDARNFEGQYDETAFSKTVDESKKAIGKANAAKKDLEKKKLVFDNANPDEIVSLLGGKESGDVLIDGVSLPVKFSNGKLYLMNGKTAVASK